MNNMGDCVNNKLRFNVVSELLQGLEGEKSIDETLMSAEKLFVRDVSGKVILQAKQEIENLKQRYNQGKLKDDEVKAEISGILLALT